MLLEEIPEPYRDSVVRLADGLLTLGGYHSTARDAITDGYALLMHWLLDLSEVPHPAEPVTVLDLRDRRYGQIDRVEPGHVR